MNDKQQLEIGLPMNPCGRRRRVQRVRPARAHWWFERMRRVVDAAVEPPPAAPPAQPSVSLTPEREAA